MTRAKKRTSRFLEENKSLFETSDIGPLTPKTTKKRKHKTLHQQAIEAEARSKKKIVAVHAPIDELKTDDETTPAPELRDDWIGKK